MDTVPVFQMLKYHGPSPELLKGPQEDGLLLHGGTVVTEVAAGATPHATAVTALLVVTAPPDDAGAGCAVSKTNGRRAAATAAALRIRITPEGDIAPQTQGPGPQALVVVPVRCCSLNVQVMVVLRPWIVDPGSVPLVDVSVPAKLRLN